MAGLASEQMQAVDADIAAQVSRETHSEAASIPNKGADKGLR